MSEIALNGINLRGPIGIYENEKKEGNEFKINLTVKIETKKAARLDDIAQTVDYEKLYKIVEEVISQPTDLIETAAHAICKIIIKNFKKVESVKIKISKLNPPISGKCKSASVKVTLTR